MYIKKILVRNYKILESVEIDLNDGLNLFVGDNDSGKSTILEALSIITSGKLNGFAFERQLKCSTFNCNARKLYLEGISAGQNPPPPSIVLEAYFEDHDPEYSGTNNELGLDCSGIRVEARLLQSHSETYLKMLSNGEIKDIPVELYSVTYNYFKGTPVVYRYRPFKSVLIDASHKEYASYVDHFVSTSITDSLSEEEMTSLSTAYRMSREGFQGNVLVKKLNEEIAKNPVLPGRNVSLDLREDDADGWKKQMSIIVDEMPFEQLGFGSQNILKVELALKDIEEQTNIVLIEEPENSLSFTTMTKLVGRISAALNKQIIISTHSSFIANKLNLRNAFIVRDGKATSMSSLGVDTQQYFVKLPGYDTLRFAIANKVILVEGPTDDLIVQRAYLDAHGHLPIEDGIDVLVVGSLAFKRYCELAQLLGKEVSIITDNDGDIHANIEEKYSEYIGKSGFHFFFEKNEDLHTIEPSVLAANENEGIPEASFIEVLSKNGSMKGRDHEGVLAFMRRNKTEWALRIFESEKCISYPEYIQDAVKQPS